MRAGANLISPPSPRAKARFHYLSNHITDPGTIMAQGEQQRNIVIVGTYPCDSLRENDGLDSTDTPQAAA